MTSLSTRVFSSRALLATSSARDREAQALVARERAFQFAEAGIDWAIAELRKANALKITYITLRGLEN